MVERRRFLLELRGEGKRWVGMGDDPACERYFTVFILLEVRKLGPIPSRRTRVEILCPPSLHRTHARSPRQSRDQNP